MKRRRWLILAALVCVTPAAGLAWLLTRPNPEISRDSYDRIQEGMTLAEVEAIVGAPPGDYGGEDPSAYGIQACQGWICSLFADWRHGTPSIPLQDLQRKLDEGRIVVWTGRSYALAVQLDAQDRVVATGIGVVMREWSWWERLLDRLGI